MVIRDSFLIINKHTHVHILFISFFIRQQSVTMATTFNTTIKSTSGTHIVFTEDNNR